MANLRENGFAYTLAAGLALALLVGIFYSTSEGSRREAPQAATLHAVHETMRAATVARAQLELGAYQVALAGGGVAEDEAAIQAAAARAADAVDAVVAGHAAVLERGESSPRLVVAVAEFEADATDLVATMTAGETAATAQLDASWGELSEELTALRDDLIADVNAAERSNALVTAVAGFLAVFAIPSAVITTYFVLDRRRRRQHELEVALEAERAAHASRERFLTSVSRELQRPLNGVQGIAQMIAADATLMDQPRMPDLHALLVGELDDINGVVADLVTASRLEAGELEYSIESVDVPAEAKTLLDSLNHRGAAVHLAMEEGVVNADRRRLRQIVRNLLTNAIKYGGPNIEIKGHAAADSYTIVVVDDGQGVPTAVAGQLFDRFVHGDAATQRVGLGLSIVMALAVGMGGTAFHERVDGLTRFGVRLPNAPIVEAEPTATPPSVSAAAGAVE